MHLNSFAFTHILNFLLVFGMYGTTMVTLVLDLSVVLLLLGWLGGCWTVVVTG